MKAPFQLIQVFDDPSHGFRGNIAAVLLLQEMPDRNTMQRIAADLNQPATSFLAPTITKGQFKIRWFAPDEEIGLCGHGSLAAIAFLKTQKLISTESVLEYQDGSIIGFCEDQSYASIQLEGIPVFKPLMPDQNLLEGLGKPIKEYWQTANKDIVVLHSEEDLRLMKPDFDKLRLRKTFGYAVTAKAKTVDFVSRTLVPHVGQLEDHATGSSHAALVPYWSSRLKKSSLRALQLSPRKGKFDCEFSASNSRVSLRGHYSILADGTMII